MIDIVAASEERKRGVMQAVHELAAKLRLEVSPRILKDSNNTIVHLAPLPLVAKVGTSYFRGASLEALDRELDVTRHLAPKQAPIILPSRDVPAGPHRAAGLIVTLWQFYEDLGAPEDERAFGPLLARVHEALLDYSDPLPPFTIELDDVERILQDRARLRRLGDHDHACLRTVHQEVQTQISSMALEHRPLPGSPHSGNWLNTPQGLLLLDFETACRGPVEWDLSAMGDEALQAFGPIDQELLGLVRRMRSLCVAVKCWIDPERAPEVGEAAGVHLRRLRGQPLD
jgi:hypothetical protein